MYLELLIFLDLVIYKLTEALIPTAPLPAPGARMPTKYPALNTQVTQILYKNKVLIKY